MKKSEIVELLKYISGAYSRFTVNENTPVTWYDMMKEQDFEKTMVLLKKHISESKFEPTISDLLINMGTNYTNQREYVKTEADIAREERMKLAYDV